MTPTVETDFLGLETFGNAARMARSPESIDLLTENDDIPREADVVQVNREANRFIWYPGDNLTPTQKEERPDLKHGGEYFGQQYKTLFRSKGLLRRCQITPMTIAYDDSDDERGAISHVAVIGNAENAVPRPRIRVYPGDEITGLLQKGSKISRGIIELTGLCDKDLNIIPELQKFVFPNWDKVKLGVEPLPVKHSELQRQIDSRLKATSETLIKEIIGQMLTACDQYRRWGMNYLKFSTKLVKQPMQNGEAFIYSELAEMLFEQLEVRREDLIVQESDIAHVVSQFNAGNVSNEQMTALIAKMVESNELLTKAFLGQIQPPIQTEVKPACADFNGKNEPCGAKVSKQIGDKWFCANHPKGE